MKDIRGNKVEIEYNRAPHPPSDDAAAEAKNAAVLADLRRSAVRGPIEQPPPVDRAARSAQIQKEIEDGYKADWPAGLYSAITDLRSRLAKAEQQIAFLSARVKPASIRDRAARSRDPTPPKAA